MVVLFEYPVITAVQLSEKMNCAYDIACSIIEQFAEAGILVPSFENNGQYIFEDYLKVLDDEY